jgi:ABC-type sugar transport system substrate-binding protein
VTVTAAALALSACGSSGSTSAGSSGSASSGTGAAKIAAVIKGLDNPFFQTMERGIKDQSASGGASTTVQAAASITDTTGQADKLTGLAGQDYSCYIVNPISGTNLVQGLAQLAAKKKTIVNIDSPIDAKAATAASATPATYIGTDNVQAGETAGKQMAKLLPQGGTVAVIGGIAGDVTSGARIEGFQKGIGSGITVVQTVAANWERQEALTQATNLLRAHPDLKGFFSANDDMGLGIARAIANSGKTGKVEVISVDGVKDALDAVKAGTLSATVAQYPYAIGLMGVEACQAAAKGKTLPTNVKAPVELITKDNATKALAVTPKPVATYDDPFAALLK